MGTKLIYKMEIKYGCYIQVEYQPTRQLDIYFNGLRKKLNNKIKKYKIVLQNKN